MILTLLVWILLSLIFIEAGRVALGSRADSILLCWFTGFAAISALAQFLSILMPLGDIFLPAILLGLLVPYLLRSADKREKARHFYGIRLASLRQKRFWLSVIVIGSVFILYKSSVVPHHFDSGLYHVQSIKWMEEYPVIPGIANLDLRMGFNSLWFASSAFSALSYTGHSFHALNGLLFLFCFLLGIRSMRNIAASSYGIADWVGILLPFTYFIFAKNISSPSPDMPATMFSCLSFYYFLRHGEGKEDYTVLVTLFAAIAICIKLSVLLIMLLPLILIVKKLAMRSFRPALESVLLIFLLLTPWLARNVINTGYLVFPATGTALIETDWKVPVERAEELKRVVSAWARIPAKPHDEVLAMSYSEWVPVWFNTTAVVMPYDKLLIFLFIAGILLRLGLIVFRRRFDTYADSAFLICVLGVLLWFMNAPDFRFVYGFLLPGIMLGFREFFAWLLQVSSRMIHPAKLLPAALLLLMAATTYLYSRVFIKDAPLSGFIYAPESYPVAESMQTVKLQNQNIHIIFDDDCQRWSAPIPAICDISILENIRFRGKKLNNGFRTRSTE